MTPVLAFLLAAVVATAFLAGMMLSLWTFQREADALFAALRRAATADGDVRVRHWHKAWNRTLGKHLGYTLDEAVDP